MKKFLPLLLTLILLSLVLTACATAPQGLVALPEEGRLLVFSLTTAAMIWLLLQIGKVIPIDLSGYGAPLAAVIAPILITLIESGLQLIPPVFDNLVLSLIHLIVLFVGGLGFFIGGKRLLFKPAPKGLLA